MDNNCKSHTCDDPEHAHQFPKMREMKKNLDKQLEKCGDTQMYGDKPDVEKALKANSAANLARPARFAVRAAAIEDRPVRHFGEAVSRTVHVTPMEEPRGDSTVYVSCNGCGVVHKSIRSCPRCEESDRITEVKDWRDR